MKCSSVAGSKYSRFSPDDRAWLPRSKSPRLWTPSSSFQPNGKRYSTSIGLLRVVGQLVGGVLAEAEPRRRRRRTRSYHARRARQPLLERRGRGVARPHEVLHLHLLELAHPEHEVAGADLVAEALADLGDAERDLLAARLLHVLEVDVRALGRLGPEVDDRGLVLDRAHERLEHQVEAARRARAGRRRPGARRPSRSTIVSSRRSVADRSSAPGSSSRRNRSMAGPALDERVAERARRGRR